MDSRFTVLASGSSGNAALLQVNGFGLLLDFGLPPRTLAARLATIGASWTSIHAVVLTHTHGDHWKADTLERFRAVRAPLFAHEAHFDRLRTADAFSSMNAAGLLRPYREAEPLALAPMLECLPIVVPHDAEPTFAFRFDAKSREDAPEWSIGFASDLGRVPAGLADAFTDVDLLAVEFNHDEQLQRASGRPAYLINRVLGHKGHLSNVQAADFARQVAAVSRPEFLRGLVQLHLSRDCNTPTLALEAGRGALTPLARTLPIVTARQDVPSRSLPLEATPASRHRLTRATTLPVDAERSPTVRVQPRLPGFDA